MNARTGFAVVLVGTLATLSVLVVEPFLSYVLGAMLLAFTLSPLQRRLVPAVGPQAAAFALVSLAVVLVVGPLSLLVTVGVAELESLPTSTEELPALQPIQNQLEGRFGVEIGPLADRLVESVTSGIADRTSTAASAGVHAFLGLMLLLFLLYYLLKDGDELVGWVKRVTPLPRDVQDDLYGEAADATWAVLKGHVLVAAVQGLVSGLGLFAFGVPNAGFWTVVMMVLAMIPIVGVAPVLGGATVYLLAEGRWLAAGLLVVYGMSAVAVTDDYLRALVIDRESSLHSGVILLGVLGAVYFVGAIGIFVGPIVLALFKATVEVFSDYYDLA
ncbi:AI-2E family transporter [Halorussus halobius]|uniref:AI-2E family transporter n=1 Tax=Halorussus halobius TaxID=1710537 RepID=UPI001091D283|nr:AI-2E family transporter [Halorussus halobius]